MSAFPLNPVERLMAYHAAIQKLDFELINSMFAENASYHSNGVGSLQGRANIIQAFRDYFAIHGDQQAIDTLVEPVDHNAARAFWQLKATNSKTGKISLRSGVETVYFNDTGLITLVDVVDD